MAYRGCRPRSDDAEQVRPGADGPIVGALIVLRYAPETMGMTLEEIELELGGEIKGDRSSVSGVIQAASKPIADHR